MKPRRPSSLPDSSKIDDQIAGLIDHVLKKHLDVKNTRFSIPALHKTVSYYEYVSEITSPVMSKPYLDGLKNIFLHLPDEYDILQKELRMVFEQVLLYIQDCFSYNEELSSYCDHLELDLGEKDSVISDLRGELNDLLISRDRDIADGRLRAYTEAVGAIQDSYPLLIEIHKKVVSNQITQGKVITDVSPVNVSPVVSSDTKVAAKKKSSIPRGRFNK